MKNQKKKNFLFLKRKIKNKKSKKIFKTKNQKKSKKKKKKKEPKKKKKNKTTDHGICTPLFLIRLVSCFI